MKKNDKLTKAAEEWVSRHGLMEYGGSMLREFCAALGIHDKTYRRWMEEDEEFRAAVDRGREAFRLALTQELSRSLADAAKGGEHEEVMTEYRPNPKNPDKPYIAKVVKKKVFVQPNVAAAIFLLTNLDPASWKNRRSNEVSGSDGRPFVIRVENENQKRLIDGLLDDDGIQPNSI